MNTVLKWLGGKSKLAGELRKHLPEGKRLIEPFAGSCAVTMNTSYEQYIIADINNDLIELYKTIRDMPDKLVTVSRDFFNVANSGIEYYRLRDLFNDRTSDTLLQSALFLYLNRHCYRGLCRYNKSKGEFNTPYGHYKKPLFPEMQIHQLSDKLKSATLICGSFKETLSLAECGDVVYCDPPYIQENCFTQYHSSGFGLHEQKELISLLDSLYQKGVSIVASSHDAPDMRDMYCQYNIESVIASRSVGVAAGAGKKANELIIHKVHQPPAC